MISVGVAVAGMLLAAPVSTAAAATGDIGYQGPSYAGAGTAPTADKPQSKLWFNDGSWWADLFETNSQTWHIFKLDRSTQTWSDTGTRIDNRPSTRGDTLWDGTHLYVATNVLASSSTANASGQPARLYRYSYSGGKYTLDSGFPANINNYSSESLALDKDSQGVLWATWTQGQKVYVNSTTGSDSSWGTPFSLGSGLSGDDISSVSAFGRNRVGVMWSNQATSQFVFAVHRDTDARTTWTTKVAFNDPGIADDHINLKQLEGDDTGHIYAAVKTSLDSTGDPNAAQNLLLGLNVRTGAWDRATFGTISDCHTRPMILIDSTNRVLHMFATGPSSGSGCPGSGTPGTIYEKTTSLDTLAFPTGRGTPVIRDAAAANMNDVTSTKQNITASTGMIVMASNDATKRYWHADVPLTGTNPAPSVSFTASPTSGTAPLAVTFKDTSTGVASWSWTFGDGGTSTAQSPTHTYTSAGTYTVTLKGTSSSGTSSTSTTVITVSGTSNGGGKVAFRSSTNNGTATAGTSMTLTTPAGVATGDVLVASFTTDNGPTVTAPSGWTSIAAVPVSGAKLVSYYHVVAASEIGTTSWTWTLDSAQKWSGGMSAYTGVNGTSPLDSAVTTKTGTGSVSVPAVTTVTSGALVVGALGADSGKVTGTVPTGFTQSWVNTAGQIADSAYRATTTVGSQGATSWAISNTGIAMAAWTVALRPASA